MSDYRNNYPAQGGGGYGAPNRLYHQNGYNGHNGPAMGPAGYQRKRQRDEDYPENNPGGNYRRRTDDRGNYGSPQQQYPRQPRPYDRGLGGGSMGHQQSLAASQTKLKESIWKLGNHADYDPIQDIPHLARSIEGAFFDDKATVFLAFRAAISELPHKLHHYASLLAHLSVKPVIRPVSLVSRISSSESGLVPQSPAAPGLPSRPVDTAGLSSRPSEQDDNDAMNEGDQAAEGTGEVKVNVGKEIVEDLMKAFQAFLDERKWKSVRYCVILFSQLTSLPVSSPLVAPTSLLTLLSSFLSVLDEPGLRLSRGDECVRIIVEALLRLEGVSDEGAFAAAGGLETLKEGVQNYVDQRKLNKDAFADDETKDQWVDTTEHLVAALVAPTGDANHLVSSILAPPALASISTSAAAAAASATTEPLEPLYLPMILVPPELEETDLSLVSNQHGAPGSSEQRAIPAPSTSAGLRGDEGVGYEGVRFSLRLFNDDPASTTSGSTATAAEEGVPSRDDKAGNVVRGLIGDIVNLYEVNRKEGAAVLLELPKWVEKGTFRDPKAAAAAAAQRRKRRSGDDGADDDESDDDDAMKADDTRAKGPGWSLENLIVETIFNSILCVPAPPHPVAYYHSLLTELCRLSPQTIAPSLGKSVRKLYASLGNDHGLGGRVGQPLLDPSGIKRFADWFAVHLSNFGFMWGWGDWAGDMEVSDKHPKRVFVKRVIELETRLSYHERIKGTIPESMLETAVMSEDAPGPEYDYDSSDHTHAAAASSFLRLIRSKASVQEAEEELASFSKSLATEHGLDEDAAERVVRDMAVQTVLNVGSRSFSHFLNALERYLVLLRNLTPTAAKKQDLLRSVSTFWRRNGQFHLIVIDKLLQYRLLEPADVITWVFSPQAEGEKRKTWADLDLWGIVAVVLRTLESRTEAGRGRVEGLKREDEAREAEKSSAAAADGDATTNEATDSNPEISSAVSYLEELESDQTKVLVQIVGEFVKLLPEDVDKDDWEVWWIEGWFREFCRVGLPPKVYARSGFVAELEKVEVPARSVVRTILDANQVWSQYA